MAYKMYGALLVSLGVVALVFATSETFARSGAAHAGGAASAHPVFRPSLAGRSLQHQHRRRDNAGGFFLGGDGGYGYGYGNGYGGYGEPGADAAQPGSGDTRYTYTYDVPWDAIHR